MKRTQKLDEIFKNSRFTSFEEEAKTNSLLDLSKIPSNLKDSEILASTGQGQIYLFRLNSEYFQIDLGVDNLVTSFEELDEETWSEFIEDFLDEESAYFYEGELVDPSILERLQS